MVDIQHIHLEELILQFTFSKDTLIVEDGEEVKTYEISYDEVPLTIEEFKRQFIKNYNIPDISSYKNMVQYNYVNLLMIHQDIDYTYWMINIGLVQYIEITYGGLFL